VGQDTTPTRCGRRHRAASAVWVVEDAS